MTILAHQALDSRSQAPAAPRPLPAPC